MSETNSENVAPYMTGTKKEEASEKQTEKKKCTPFGRCYIVGISLVTFSFMAVIIASFFQDEFNSVVANLSSNTPDEVVAVTDTAEVVVANDEIVIDEAVQINDQPAQAAVVRAEPFYAYQPFNPAVTHNNVFANIQQKHRAAIDEAMHQQNARIAELNQLRSARFERIEQDRIARLNRFETMRAKTQAIQQEMQQKMQQAYNDFHSI